MQAVSFRRPSALCAVVLSLAALAVLPAGATATSSQGDIDAAIGKAVEYVRGQQDPLTGEPFGFEHSSFSSDWVATSLAAAGVSAVDVLTPGNPSLQDFLFGDYTDIWKGAPTKAVTEYERATLVSYAAGLDPARLSADLNLPAQVAGVWNPVAGTFGSLPSINSTAFGILALKTAPVPAWALDPAVSYLRQRQHDDGGWTFSAAADPAAKAEPSEPDMTGAAIAALCETGVPAYDPPVAPALAYLKGLLVDATGAFHSAFGDNADATAWAVSGLRACGIDPQSPTWTTAANRTPIDHLLSLQVPAGPEAGGFGYESSGEAPNLYSTQDALRAIAGGVFTAPPPARSDSSQASVRAVPAIAAGTPVPHLLAIELAPGNVRMCHVVAPEGAALSAVLSAARAVSYPAGCVTSFSLSGGHLATLDGVAPEGEGEAWLLRLDRGPLAPAGEQPVRFGEVVSLRLGSPPDRGEGSILREGPAGAAGAAGAPGRVVKSRHGRRARARCRGRRRHSGKRRGACGGKHRHRRLHRSNTLPVPTNP